ncbi:hypothetical protein BDB00DRAFT_113266 [Zychaea mexicana]|uniref:uncharacterized protein n=1 Tax=Zychaea mexicana TaxID=64656 RepID=UPI0022FE087C|nr:uncharacterized protein BDB00DRAFT_113266 [Zychaea mexicana]KAI9484759.1 hypothetical protein BDB00DRAFT_113266 [Zychaea mexicana]
MTDVSTTAIVEPLPPQSDWELAFVYAFISNFRKHTNHGIHPFPDLQPEDLEQALHLESSELLDDLLGSFLSNVLNRKKRLESKHHVKELSKLINTKLQALEVNLDHNPLSQVSSFGALPAAVKLKILRSLVEWQLQESTLIRSILDTALKSSDVLRLQPIGTDSEKRIYWHFGDAAWLWREKPTLKAKYRWETVCRDLEELQQFTENLSKDKRHERALYQHLIEQVIPYVENAQRKRQRKARALERQLAVAEELATPRRLRSRENVKPVKYTFDDDFDDAFEDEGAVSDGFQADEGMDEDDDEESSGGEEMEGTQRATQMPVRSSRRLNPGRRRRRSSVASLSLSPSPTPPHPIPSTTHDNNSNNNHSQATHSPASLSPSSSQISVGTEKGQEGEVIYSNGYTTLQENENILVD